MNNLHPIFATILSQLAPPARQLPQADLATPLNNQEVDAGTKLAKSSGMNKPAKRPWKSHPMARRCYYAGCRDPIKPGMQPLRLNGKRGWWHLRCFECERATVTQEERHD